MLKQKHWRTPAKVVFSIQVAFRFRLSLSDKSKLFHTAYYVALQMSVDLNDGLILFAFQLFIIKRLIVPDDNVFTT